MEYKHQRNICQIIHKFFRNKKTKYSQIFKISCYSAAAADTGEA